MKKFLIVLLCLITVVSLGVTLYLVFREDSSPEPAGGSNVVYPPISRDPNAESIGTETSVPPLSNPSGGGAVSLSYSTTLTAPAGDGTARMMFQNPPQSNQSIVVQLHITDEELINKIGKTGRTESERQKVETASGYDPKTSRMIVAESGLLAPGFKLTKLKLNALPDGTVLPAGTYHAVYYILAYDKVTNERAIVNMQIPVTLTIGE